MIPQRPTRGHSVLAKHVSKKNANGLPLMRWFTYSAFDKIPKAKYGDKYHDKGGWIQIQSPTQSIPEAALKALEASAKKTEHEAEKPKRTRKKTTPSTLDFDKMSGADLVQYVEENNINIDGYKIMARARLVELLKEKA